MGIVRHGLYRRPWPSCARSSAMGLFPASWVTPGALGLLWFKLGGGLYPTFTWAILKGFLPPHHGRPPWPLPPPVALRRPFQGNMLNAHIVSNSRCAWFVMIQAGGGALPNFYLHNFRGFFGWLSSQQSTGFVGRKGNSSGVSKSEGKCSGEGSDVGRCGDVNCGGNRDSNSDSWR
jgi:hypothetical protein